MFTTPFTVQLTTITTSATPNTLATTLIIGAPGAGNRLRIVGYKMWTRRDSTGLVDLTLVDTAAISFIGGGSVSVQGPDTGFVPMAYPGFQLGDNLGLNCQHNSTMASQLVRVVVHYYIDFVT